MNMIPILDIPRGYTALAEWMACMMFIILYKPRYSWKKTAPLAALALTVQVLFLFFTDNLSIWFWIPCMVIAVALMFLQLILLCDIDAMAAAYTCIRAFILAEFTASLEWQLHCYLWPIDNWVWYQRFSLLLLVYAAVIAVCGILEKRYAPKHIKLTVSRNELLALFVLGLAVFILSNLSFFVGSTPFSSHYASEIMNTRTLADAIGVALLYAFHIQHSEVQIRKELSAMESILESQYAQYRMSRDSIDMINRKYHDLKHQISALRTESDAARRNEWLDEMEADIKTYEAQNKTGNSVLDVLLTGKSLYCQKHGIEFTVVADGRLLNFMDAMDICTLFGNALDNAIEYERKISDKDKRIIHLTLNTQKQFLLLQVENYCPETLSFRDGLPVTTKDNKAYHGFGLKSLQYTAEKYNGTTTIRTENNWFILKVIIPLGAQ